MYHDHFGLFTAPFSLGPHLRFVYRSTAFEETMAHLVYGLEGGEDIVLITGEIGTGKTLALYNLIKHLSKTYRTALVNVTQVDFRELLKLVLAELGVTVPPKSDRADLLTALKTEVIATHRQGRRLLLIVDEAQNLSDEILEGVRLLTNLGPPGEQVLQLVLSGQPALRSQIDTPQLAQLRQRIRVHYHLDAMTRRETEDYIAHRLQVAGAEKQLFQREALDRVYEYSGGIPRLVNILADRALLSAYVDGSGEVKGKHVEEDRELARSPQRETTAAAQAARGAESIHPTRAEDRQPPPRRDAPPPAAPPPPPSAPEPPAPETAPPADAGFVPDGAAADADDLAPMGAETPPEPVEPEGDAVTEETPASASVDAEEPAPSVDAGDDVEDVVTPWPMARRRPSRAGRVLFVSLTVVALALAVLAYFAWRQGVLDDLLHPGAASSVSGMQVSEATPPPDGGPAGALEENAAAGNAVAPTDTAAATTGEAERESGSVEPGATLPADVDVPRATGTAPPTEASPDTAASAGLETGGLGPAAAASSDTAGAADRAAMAETAEWYRETMSPGLYVHVGSFRELHRAGVLARELVDSALEPVIHSAIVRGDLWYRVYVGPYEDLASAQAAEAAVHADKLAGWTMVVRIH